MAFFHRLPFAVAALCCAGLAVAAPQGVASSIPPSPTGLDCTLHQDHWDCITPCATSTTTQWGIATTVTDYTSWRNSMNSVYSSSGVRFSGPSVPVYTTVGSFGNGAQVTATVHYNSAALSSAGYTFTSTITTVVSCPPTTTPTLPPSPTGSLCSPHGDHWHCEPYPSTTAPDSSNSLDTATTATGTCTPHGDHWHCPPGVSEPTTPPPMETSTTSPTSPPTGECEPHGDHWHCPSGVPEPTTPPPATSATTSQPAGECEPHGDHWHCPSGVPEPTTPPPTTSATTSRSVGECEPHGDHWHCPSGVPEPTTPPNQQPTSGVTQPPEGECEPHGDHWHCPPGVPEPTTPPPQSSGAEPTPSSGSGASATGACEPHGDHWHCPPGVPEPSAPPAASSIGTSGSQPETTGQPPSGECVPHGDHWHCPSGVPEPTTPPGGTLTTVVTPSSTARPSAVVTAGSNAVVASPLFATLVLAVLFAAALY